jgi:glucose-6-phosphate 1-dehydrogenase
MRGIYMIFGATGDLTGRYLMPAIAKLVQCDAFTLDGPILGVGQQDWTTPQFKRHVAERLDTYAAEVRKDAREKTCERLEYQAANVGSIDDLTKLLRGRDVPVVLYLALPPTVAAKGIRALTKIRLPEGSRIVCEKPFGHDAASARELNELLRLSFLERHVFRIDHFLAKQEVQNVLGLRFANRFFEYLWNRDHIELVQITWDETLALEGRAATTIRPVHCAT